MARTGRPTEQIRLSALPTTARSPSRCRPAGPPLPGWLGRTGRRGGPCCRRGVRHQDGDDKGEGGHEPLSQTWSGNPLPGGGKARQRRLGALPERCRSLRAGDAHRPPQVPRSLLAPAGVPFENHLPPKAVDLGLVEALAGGHSEILLSRARSSSRKSPS